MLLLTAAVNPYLPLLILVASIGYEMHLRRELVYDTHGVNLKVH